MTPQAENLLKNWLLGAEKDIAKGDGRFGMLWGVFKELIGREPCAS